MPQAHHLMLVEDDLLILRTLARGLREAGYRISEAESAEEAMQVCSKTQPDLAVLDIRMRGLSGLELGRWLAERDQAIAVLPQSFAKYGCFRLIQTAA